MQGTAGAAAKQAACSSALFTQRLADACAAQPETFSQFTNRLFNTLNWTATEFISSLKVRGLGLRSCAGSQPCVCPTAQRCSAPPGAEALLTLDGSTARSALRHSCSKFNIDLVCLLLN